MKEKGGRRRAVLVALLSVVVVVCAAGGVFAAYWPSVLRARVIAGAKERGVDLSVETIEAKGLLPWEGGERLLILSGVEAKLAAAPEVTIAATTARVSLQGMEPQRIDLEGLRVSAGSVPDLLTLEREARTGSLSKTPVAVQGASLRIGRVIDALPVPVLVKMTRAEAGGGELELEGLTVEIAIPFLGPDAAPIAIDLERKDGMSWITPHLLRKVRLGIDDDASRVVVVATDLPSTRVAELVQAKLPSFTLTGKVELELDGDEEQTSTRSTVVARVSFDAEIRGYVPPHPRELDGIVFGDRTNVTGRAHVLSSSNAAGWRQNLMIDTIKLDAGALSLAGPGEMSLDEVLALKLSLSGSVGCAAIARSAAGAHFGAGGAFVTGLVARGRLEGSIAVRLDVKGSLRDVEHLAVTPYASLGCKVRI